MAKSMRIRKDDKVIVIGGKDRGKTGRVAAHRAEASSRVYVEGLNIIKRHERPRSIKDDPEAPQAGGIIEKEGPIHVSNVMLLDPNDNKPTRVGVRATKAASASASRSAAGRRSTDGSDRDTQTQAAPPPRLRERYEQEVLPALTEQVRLLDADAGAAPGEDHPQHGRRRGQAGRQDARGRAGAAGDDRRPAAERAPRPQVDRLLQGPRGDAGRRLGDPARRPHVGVPRPALSRSRSRGSATSAGSTRAPSTAAATTRWASASS